MVARFDCYPSDFLNGVLGLTADQIAAYTVVMMMQYDRGEPVPYRGREREIAVRSGITVGRLAQAVAHLVSIGKLVQTEEGRLSNPRTVLELSKIEQKFAENRENSAKGGSANQEKWREKRSKNNEGKSRPASQADSRTTALNYLPSLPTIVDDPSDHCPKPDKPVRTRHAYPDDFEDWWSAYPTDSNMSKAEALKPWNRLSEADKRDARASLSAFRAYCGANPDYRPLHANRYLSQRRWEGHLRTAEAVGKRIFVHRDSPQWSAWEKHLRGQGQRMPPTDQKGGWYFDQEWPPRANSVVHERASA